MSPFESGSLGLDLTTGSIDRDRPLDAEVRQPA